MPASLLRAVPNTISAARLVLGLCFPWVPAGWRVPVIVAAALSDLADGAISRLAHATGPTGRILDPVADKVFVLSVLGTLLMEERLRLWEVALIGLRDWAVLFGVGWRTARRNRPDAAHLSPTLLGKVTTALQFTFVLAVLTAEWAARLLFLPTVAVSGIAALDYLRRGLAMEERESRRSSERRR